MAKSRQKARQDHVRAENADMNEKTMSRGGHHRMRKARSSADRRVVNAELIVTTVSILRTGREDATFRIYEPTLRHRCQQGVESQEDLPSIIWVGLFSFLDELQSHALVYRVCSWMGLPALASGCRRSTLVAVCSDGDRHGKC